MSREPGAPQVQINEGETARVDFEFAGCEIHCNVRGIAANEKALLALLPADAQLPEWSVAALEALGERVVANDELLQDGSLIFDGIQEGEYIVGAVALPAESQTDTEQLLGGRVAVSPIFYVAPGTPAQVDLVFK